MNNKSLLIPYIPELDNKAISNVSSILEEKGAKCSIDSLTNPQEYPYHPLTIVMAAHSGDALYVDFFVRCNYLRAANFKNNSPVWEDSSVSFFVQPSAGGEYWNFDFNCIGTTNAAHRLTRRPVTRLTDSEIAQIETFSSCGTKPFRELEGLFAWNVIVRIPFSLIGINMDNGPMLMRGNFCKSASATSQPHYLTWNPVTGSVPDFHTPEAFGDIILAAKA